MSTPTMADGAKRAGVALSIVSHVLSGKRPLLAEVRRRVLRAREEPGYQLHVLPCVLATKQTRTITLLYPSLTSEMTEPHLEFVSEMLHIQSIPRNTLREGFQKSLGEKPPTATP